MKSFATLSLLASVATLATASAHHDSEPLAHKRRAPGWIRKRQIQRRQDVGGNAILLTVANSTSYNASSEFAGTAIVANTTSHSSHNSTSAAKVAPAWYKGTALWFIETGSQSACYTHHTDEDIVVGLPLQFWNNTGVVSDYCGQYLEIKNTDNKKTVTALISDASGSNYTTLTKAAFLKLASLKTGMIDIEYTFLNATSSASNSTATLHDSNVLVAPKDGSPVPTTITSTAASKATSTTKPTTQASSDDSSDSDASSRSKAAAYAASVKADDDAAAASSSSQAAYFSSKKSAEAASSSKEAANYAASSSSAAAAQASAEAKAQREAAAASREAAAEAQASADAADAKASRQAAADAAASKTAKAEAQAAAATAKANAQVSVSAGSSSSSSDDEHTGGFATFYTQNGVAGNCGTVAKDSDYVIALPTAMYANGAHCGQKIRATRVSDGASVVGTVRDSCPTCINNDCLDMSVAMFTSIATEEEGQVAITWTWA